MTKGFNRNITYTRLKSQKRLKPNETNPDDGKQRKTFGFNLF